MQSLFQLFGTRPEPQTTTAQETIVSPLEVVDRNHHDYQRLLHRLENNGWPNLEKNIANSIRGAGSLKKKLEFVSVLQKLRDTTGDTRLSDSHVAIRNHMNPEDIATGILAEVARDLESKLHRQHSLCPSTTQLLLQHVRTEGLALARLVLSHLPDSGRPGRFYDHRKCTSAECLASQSTVRSVKMKNSAFHLCDKGDCPELSVQEDKIVTSGTAINLIFLPLDEEPESDLTPCILREDLGNDTTRDYIAISYVWAQMHPISRCQLKKLVPALRKLSDSPSCLPIWLDFFCIPQSEQFNEAKNEALSMMPTVYERATWILVVDDLLLQASCDQSGTAIGVMVLASQWMKRLWTLPEAVNATLGDRTKSRLVFCLRDGVVLFSDLLQRIDDEAWYLGQLVGRALTDLLLIPRSSGVSTKFRKLFNAVEYRSASRIEDEAPCLAGILCSGDEIKWPQIREGASARDTADARMKHLFGKVLTEFPLSILFMDGVRLNDPRFSWLPNSLIAGDTQLRPRSIGSARIGHGTQPHTGAPSGIQISKQPDIMARWAKNGLAFHADKALVFSFDSNTEADFTRLYLKYETRKDRPSSESNMGRPTYWQQTRLDQTHWERNLAQKKKGSAYGDGQGWRQLDTVQRSDQLLLISDVDCVTEGIILRIAAWNGDTIEARFVCRAFVTPRPLFKVKKKPDAARKPGRPGFQAPNLRGGQQFIRQGDAVPVLLNDQNGHQRSLLGHQMNTTTPLEGDEPTKQPELLKARKTEVVQAEEKVEESSEEPQESDEDMKEWKNKYDPAHGIVALVAYGIQDCDIILIE